MWASRLAMMLVIITKIVNTIATLAVARYICTNDINRSDNIIKFPLLSIVNGFFLPSAQPC